MAERTAVDGFWLPTREPAARDLRDARFGPDRVPVRVPRLTPAALTQILDDLRAAQAAVLGSRRADEIVEAVAGAAARLTRPEGATHQELLEILPGLTGYSEQMIALGLERMGEVWSAEALRAAITAEFGDLRVLDAFQRREPSGRYRAYGPPVAVHIFSGNIPGVAVTSLMRALCVKSACFGKTASGEPYLPVRFARELAEIDAELARCLAITYWPGGSEELEAIAFGAADAVIAYGGDAAIADIRRRLPSGVRFLGYPSRVGAGLVGRHALRDPEAAADLAAAAARDVAAFDQQGCVSPHTVFVERGGALGPREFAESLAAALERLAAELPRGRLDPAESTRIHQLRAEAEMRGATVLASPRGTEWTVIVEEDRPFEPSPLNRVVFVRPVDDLGRAIESLAPVGRHLQTVALEAGSEELESLAARLGEIGATRVVPLGAAAWPAAHWHHDGRFQFLDLVRFVDLEG